MLLQPKSLLRSPLPKQSQRSMWMKRRRMMRWAECVPHMVLIFAENMNASNVHSFSHTVLCGISQCCSCSPAGTSTA